MRTNLLAFFLALCSVAAFAQSQESSDRPAFAWAIETHDVGEIPQGTPKEVVFEFTNNGKAPLIISNVRSSCGCTVPSWTKEPLLPGETGEIKAIYNARSAGAFHKTVTVTSNAATPTVVLHIKGKVVESAGE